MIRNNTESHAPISLPKAIHDAVQENQGIIHFEMCPINQFPVNERLLGLYQALETNAESITSLDLTSVYNNLNPARLFAALSKNKTLTTLDLRLNRLNSSAVQTLTPALSTIRHLSLGNNSLGDAGMVHLAAIVKTNASLTALHLVEADFGVVGSKALAEALHNHTALTDLALARNALGPDSALHFAILLRNNHSLTSLNFNDNYLRRRGVQCLLTALFVNQTLKELGFLNNSLDEGEDLKLEVLCINRGLTSLNLSEIPLTSQEYDNLCSALTHYNDTVTLLNLSETSLSRDQIIALADMLKHNQTLLSLSLNDNKIDSEGAEALANGLQHNQALFHLGLSGDNAIGLPGLRAFADMLHVNRSLCTLDIGNRNFIGSHDYDPFSTDPDDPAKLALASAWPDREQVGELCERNEAIQNRLQRNWGKVAILTAFLRANANAGSQIKNSVLALIPGITRGVGEATLRNTLAIPY